MGMLFLIAGILFFVAAYRGGTAPADLIGILKSDFTGPNNFFVWALALGFVSGIGYIPKLRPLANALFVLVILALILAHSSKDGSNIITSFFKQIRSTERA